jgi:uncharacterized protein (TIGR02145 family)
MKDNVITTSVTEFKDDELVTKAYIKNYLSRDTVKDIDGNVYKIVHIGHQTWMAENMRVRNYTNDDGTKGDAIPHDNSDDGSDGWEDNENCYSFFAKTGTTDTEGDENDPEFKSSGLLYQWNAAMNGSTTEGARGICPIGWHIPTKDDLHTLQEILGDDSMESNTWTNGEAENIGTALKYGKFNAVFSGRRSHVGAKWYDYGNAARIMTSREYSNDCFHWNLKAIETGVLYYQFNKDSGWSVRCIKD